MQVHHHAAIPLSRLFAAALASIALWFAVPASAQGQAQASAAVSPNEFVQHAVDHVLATIREDPQLKTGDMVKLGAIVDKFIVSYVNFQKTTRLAAGKYWRDATPEQRTELANAFRGTLLRTYAGALARVENSTTSKVLPFRGDPNAADAVVHTQLFRIPNAEPTQIDYRLEKAPDGWRIYDINVENVWLIENYRNQFSQQISQNGIDGLIKALNTRNQ